MGLLWNSTALLVCSIHDLSLLLLTCCSWEDCGSEVLQRLCFTGWYVPSFFAMLINGLQVQRLSFVDENPATRFVLTSSPNPPHGLVLMSNLLQYDPNAIRVDNVVGDQIGHLPRKIVEKITPYVVRLHHTPVTTPYLTQPGPRRYRPRGSTHRRESLL